MTHPALALALASLLAVPAVAQQPAPRDTTRHQMPGHQMPAGGMAQHQMQGMGGCPMMHGDSAGGMMAGMMAAMATAPEHLLAQKVALSLTPEQERRITALRDAARPGHDAAMRTGEMHAREGAQAMQAAAPDTAAVRMHYQAALAAMGQAHLAMLAASAQARAVLTDAQRRQLDSMHAGMGGGGMMMMQHEHRP